MSRKEALVRMATRCTCLPNQKSALNLNGKESQEKPVSHGGATTEVTAYLAVLASGSCSEHDPA